MTGHGHASGQLGSFAIDVEVRTVNNRFLKLNTKISECVAAIESQLEHIVRKHVRRGSVQLTIRVSEHNLSNASKVCEDTLRSYIAQTQRVVQEFGGGITMELGSMLQLPGVLERPSFDNAGELLSAVARVVEEALLDLNRMRCAEGEAMANQLAKGLQEIECCRNRIETRAPLVIGEYRSRLESRVRAGLADLGHHAAEVELLREVLQYSDRCDIREELVRLASHLSQFSHSMSQAESQGRKLDFLIQELIREVNTIGSKANDATIAHDVVNIKTIIEQIRELVQNVE
jgi:uncharacterized protein (TIGR00255 family)